MKIKLHLITQDIQGSWSHMYYKHKKPMEHLNYLDTKVMATLKSQQMSHRKGEQTESRS